MSAISVSLDNPYGDVTIPRAKLRGEDSLVIGNPGALDNPYNKTVGGTNERPGNKLLSFNTRVQGLSGVDIVGMEELGLSSPPPGEPAVAHHLNPSQWLTTAGPSLEC
ncbi:hypothetical protein CRUP_009164 [Coryphaenoides rupestris]|nr:hypothetical protein CRUP_009164 [Coryphaenoides rupestris]